MSATVLTLLRPHTLPPPGCSGLEMLLCGVGQAGGEKGGVRAVVCPQVASTRASLGLSW